MLVVVHSTDGYVLMMQRKGEGSEAFWQSVTGSLEWGEGVAAAAQRELQEETGLLTLVAPCHWASRYEVRPAALHRYAAGTRWNTEHLFHACVPRPVAVTLAVAEHTRYDWLPKAVAIERAWSWSNRDAIRQLVA